MERYSEFRLLCTALIDELRALPDSAAKRAFTARFGTVVAAAQRHAKRDTLAYGDIIDDLHDLFEQFEDTPELALHTARARLHDIPRAAAADVTGPMDDQHSAAAQGLDPFNNDLLGHLLRVEEATQTPGTTPAPAPAA